MFARLLPIASRVASLVAGCEKTDHENIDKWTHTEKGPDKLKKALSPTRRSTPICRRTPRRTWSRQRRWTPTSAPAFEHDVAGPPARRSSTSSRRGCGRSRGSRARTLLPDAAADRREGRARQHPQVRRRRRPSKQIDGYLIDWYGVTSYEERAQGRRARSAPTVMRMVGPRGGKKLIERRRTRVIAAPGQDKVKNTDRRRAAARARGDRATPTRSSTLLDIAQMDRGDPTLPARAMRRAARAYVDPGGLFDVAEPAPLVPNLDGAGRDREGRQTSAGAAQRRDRPDPRGRAAGVRRAALSMIALPAHEPQLQVRRSRTTRSAAAGRPRSRDVVRALPGRVRTPRTISPASVVGRDRQA